MIDFNPAINAATKAAQLSKIVRGKVACVLFTNRGRVVVVASNKRIDGIANRFTIHAEEYAIAKANKLRAVARFGRLNALVVRWRPSTEDVNMAKPCPKCAELLRVAGIKTIFYTDQDGCINKL